MMKIKYILPIGLLALSAACATQHHSKNQNKNEWISLFNGRNLDNWIVKIHHHDVDVNFANTFRVKDGVIQVNYDGYGDFNEQYGHLYYKTPYSDYHVKLEYRFYGDLQRVHHPIPYGTADLCFIHKIQERCLKSRIGQSQLKCNF
ncbi:DUF1080 domain-containing protein [Sphingobacterium sp. IITKGP-BTPF85]|uniref:3-keto-disaccharide hydrolase n=1 Tax=Sphingobacterium sp. IITKGP-BTPF85 TaxID=1338009 RepID=UPI0006335368|nr:hypothetical protein L950_0202780 [Sphingobacterium sp. IITKGP-BTPF85]